MIALAWVALCTWPFIAFAFFRTMSVPTALTATLIGGYLFLPEQVGFDLPALPALDKSTVPTLAAMIALAIVTRTQASPYASTQSRVVALPGILPRNFWFICLILLAMVGAVGTVLTNDDAFVWIREEDWREPEFLPGVPALRIVPSFVGVIFTILPFLLGRKYLATDEAQLKALKTMVFLAFAYSFLALFEIRMSPQLNNWIYGFFPHSFAQHIRGGGYRPLVFLNHGLWLASFLSMAVVASFGLARFVPKNQRAIFLGLAAWLYVTLFLTKSLGAFLLANVFCLLFLFPRSTIRLGLLSIAVLVLAYPLLRSFDLLPVEYIADLAALINTDRADSLSFRFRHEAAILEHASQRPLFGWDLFGRNLAVEVDFTTAVPDGRWVIVMSGGGYAGFLSEFGLLAIGIFGFVFGRKHISSSVSLVVAIILAMNLIDLIPNATLTTLTWFWAGSLVGRVENRRVDATEQGREQVLRQDTTVRPVASYSRGVVSSSPYRRQFTQEHGKRP